jgi:hypothetical protein
MGAVFGAAALCLRKLWPMRDEVSGVPPYRAF